MKTILLLLLTFASVNAFAQTTTIYGKVIKSDGTRIKGTSVIRGYEDQLIISNLSGGTDNTASIELEVPTSGYMAAFRTMMNTPSAQPKTAVAKRIAATAVKSAGTAMAAMPERTMTLQSLTAFPISRIDISVTTRINNEVPVLTRQVILEDIRVESCTDNIASGTSKIKFKANRIGWIYINRGPDGKVRSADKSGWDRVSGTAWTNF